MLSYLPPEFFLAMKFGFSMSSTATFVATLLTDLIHKIRERERQQRIRQRRRDRDGRRMALSYDAPPFQMPSEGGGALDTLEPSVPGSSSGPANGSGLLAADPLSSQRRQLGERLYPKVHTLQPVGKLDIHFACICKG